MPYGPFTQGGGFMDEPSPTPLQRGVLDPAYSLVSGKHPMLTFGAWGLSALVGGATMKSALAGTSLTKYGRQALLSPHYGGLAQAGNLGRSIQPFSGQGLLTTSVLERELDIVKNNPATKPHWFKRVRSKMWGAVRGGGARTRTYQGALEASLGNANHAAKVNAMDDIVRAAGAKPGTNAASRALRRAGLSRGQISRFHLGRSIKGFGKVVGLAELGFMAFNFAANMATKPVPLKPPIPIRTTALGGTFYDTGIAYTQRRRALEMIHSTQYSGRSGLGNEASIIHG